MPLIAGLGNPGLEYEQTPHNIGFAVLDELARRSGVAFKRSASGQAHEASFGGSSKVVLLKPQSYMNRSGGPVQAALRYYRWFPADLLAICDDVNIPPGFLRFRKQGGAGGQKGLESIIRELGTDEFARLRIGVGGGHPGADVASHVLRKFSGSEKKTMAEAITVAADAVESYIRDGLQVAMNKYNTVKSKTDSGDIPAGAKPSPAEGTEGSKRRDENV